MDYPNESMTLPTSLLKKYVSKVFVETGSYDGRTIQQALDVGFEYVMGVEVDHNYATICKERFKDHPNVQIWEGDSLDLLWQMIEGIQATITYWLDSHIQDTGAHGKVMVPLLQELDIISQHPHIQKSVIMIDDRRLFGHTGSPGVWQPVTEQMVLDKLSTIIPNSLLTYEDSLAAPNDILVLSSLDR